MRLFAITLLILGLSGCATVVKKEEIIAQAKEIKAAAVKTAVPQTAKITVPKESIFSAQEKLVYKARVFGIPIGEFIAVNKGLTNIFKLIIQEN